MGSRNLIWNAVKLTGVVMACQTLHAQSATSHCDPSLKVNDQNPLSYRLRDDRCEGVYAQDVSNTTLAVVSLTETFVAFDPASVRSVPIHWVSPGQASVHLRALSTPFRSYFRMDSRRPPGATSFEWPTAVLAQRKLSSKDIGVVGSFDQVIDQTRRTIYLPLQVGSNDDQAWKKTYQLRLVPGGDLSEVNWSLSALGPDGRSLKSLIRGRKGLQGLYPQGKPFVIELQGFEQPGVYLIEVAGSSDLGPVGTSLWLLHPNR